MRIALDAMGGDYGSKELVNGALMAVGQAEDLQVTLVGDEQILADYLQNCNASRDVLEQIDVLHTSEFVEMNESPVEAIRKKKKSSIMLAFDLVRNGEADATVSAGNSGATMAAALRKLGRLKNVIRPGIASVFPTLKKPVVMMDVGANVDCRPQHLLQFAVMAGAFSRIFDISTPSVGLLSIGEEAGKGNSLVKDTYPLLQQSSMNFIGNVEGRDVFQGDVDVVVCDGFVGNICLKISEGLVEAATQMLRNEVMGSMPAKVGYLLAKPAVMKFKKRVDYAEYGGAPLLGINGTGIISHGKSSAQAIKNAIMVAEKTVKNNVNKDILHNLARIDEELQVAAVGDM